MGLYIVGAVIYIMAFAGFAGYNNKHSPGKDRFEIYMSLGIGALVWPLTVLIVVAYLGVPKLIDIIQEDEKDSNDK